MKKIILSAFMLYLPFQLRVPQTLGINTLDIFLILLMLTFIFARNSKIIGPRFHVPLLLFLCIWIISFLHTIFFPQGIWALYIATEFKRLITLVFGYFVFASCVNSKKELNFFLYVFILSIILVGFDTWRNGVLAGPSFAEHKRSSGPFALGWQGADIAGGFLAIFTPFVLSQALFTKQKLLRLISLGGFGICVMGLLATYSRGSILALVASIIMIVLFSIKYIFKTSKFLAIPIIAVMMFGLLGWRYWVPESIIARTDKTVTYQAAVYEGHSGTSSFDESTEKRITIWKMGMELFWRNPLTGVGFKKAQSEMGVDTHNAFILIAAEMGIFGIMIFTWFLWQVFREARSLLSTEFIGLGVGFIGCIAAFCVANMFYSTFFRDTVVGTFWVILGILAASKQCVSRGQIKIG